MEEKKKRSSLAGSVALEVLLVIVMQIIGWYVLVTSLNIWGFLFYAGMWIVYGYLRMRRTK